MPPIKTELLDELLSGVSSPDDLLGDGGVFRQLKKALMERALGAELTHHLGYEKGAAPAGRARGNSRNGRTGKTVLTEDGQIELAIPRDRAGTFEPKLVPKGVTRLEGFDSRIISLYARGLSVREIQAHLKDMYGTEVSPDLISRVTDAVLEEVREWQNRPLDPMYPIVFFDAIRVKVRDEGIVKNKAVYVALALDTEGQKHVLGLWIEQTEGAKFWLKVMNDLKTRGLADILIAVVDGLKGFSGGDRRSLPGGSGADLHRAPDPELSRIRFLERPKKSCPGPQTCLSRREPGAWSGVAGWIRGQMGETVSDDRADVASGVAVCDAAVRFPAGDPENDLYDQRCGEPESLLAQDHQDPGQLPHR